MVFSSITTAIHFLQPERSYNNYATELSSPLFLVVPDLVNNLFKKCSWLLLISYVLELCSLFGVYTLCGNITVVIATIVWVAIEYGYPFSVPFSLVTYISLMFVTFSFHGPPMSGKICGLECSRSKLLLWIQVS